MLTFTIPAFLLILVAAFLAGIIFGVWLLLTKVK